MALGTLCWSCKKACPKAGERGCSWVESCEPVAGWDAERHYRAQNGKKHAISYLVKVCPGFESEHKTDQQVSDKAEMDGCVRLAEGLFDSMAKSYIGFLDSYAKNPCQFTKSELLTFEKSLSRGVVPKILPGKLSVQGYIKHMRELYLPKASQEALNFQFKHTL